MKYLFWEHCRQSGIDILKHRKTFFFGHLIAFVVNLTLIVSITFEKILTERLKTQWHQQFENLLRRLYQQTCFFFFFFFFFSDVKRQISLVLKVTAKMYLICFQAKRQSRRWLTSFFSRRTCGNYMDVIALSCNAIIIEKRINTSRMASFWIPSHIIILYAIYIYMFICSIYIVHLFFNWQGGAAFELE